MPRHVHLCSSFHLLWLFSLALSLNPLLLFVIFSLFFSLSLFFLLLVWLLTLPKKKKKEVKRLVEQVGVAVNGPSLVYDPETAAAPMLGDDGSLLLSAPADIK